MTRIAGRCAPHPVARRADALIRRAPFELKQRTVKGHAKGQAIRRPADTGLLEMRDQDREIRGERGGRRANNGQGRTAPHP